MDLTQSIPNGTKVIFHLKGMVEEILHETGYDLNPYDSQEAIVRCIATWTKLGEKDYEYYDIIFNDGFLLEGISGYHLEIIN